MNIVYACNDYYIPQTGISIISVCENNKDIDNITFYFLSDNVSDSNIQILENIVSKYNRKLEIIPFKQISYDLNISDLGRHIATIYAKVFFSRIEGLNRAIYLDSDIVVVGSLQELWNTDLDGCYMGAVQTFTKSRAVLGLPEDYPFFNDGMAIVNVDYCRKNDLIEKVKAVVDKFDGAPPVLSEGALNVVCKDHVKYISLRYNLMAGILYFYRLDKKYLYQRLSVYPPEDISESCKHPVCIHYLTAFYNRPWFTPCNHPYRDEYYKYQEMSPWNELKPTPKSLPMRTRMIDLCFRLLGTKLTNIIRGKVNS